MNCDISMCGSSCCHNCAVLTEDEVSKLILDVRKEYGIQIELKKFFKKVKGELGMYYAIKMIKGKCIFLNNEKRCRIYMCRPVLCELYPVIDIDEVDDRCPGAKMLPNNMVMDMKRRYAEEINENVKAEQTFMFV